MFCTAFLYASRNDSRIYESYLDNLQPLPQNQKLKIQLKLIHRFFRNIFEFSQSIKRGRTIGPNVRLWDITNFLVSSNRWQSILESDCVQYIFITFWFKILVPDFLDIFKNVYLLKLPYKDSKNIIWILYLEALF